MRASRGNAGMLGLCLALAGSALAVGSASTASAATASTWGSTTALSQFGAAQPQLAASSSGATALATWKHWDGSHDVVQVRVAAVVSNVANWGTAVNVSNDTQNADAPQIAVSADGTKATAIWRRLDGSNWIIQSASATISGSTATWGSVTDLSASGQNADAPQIGLSASGEKATAVWTRSDGSNSIIQSASATISGSTATWGLVTDLSAAGRDAFTPQVAVAVNGEKATALWWSPDGTNWIVQTKSATIAGIVAAWGSVTDLSAAGQDASSAQGIDVSDDGENATAVWSRSDGSNSIIQTKSATISGNVATWGAVTDLSASGQAAESAQVALSDDGEKATVVWSRYDGAATVVQTKSATISGDTATWGSLTDLSDSARNAYQQQIALSSDGTKGVAIWFRNDGSYWIVQTRRATIAGNVATWGSVAELTATGATAGFPHVSLSTDGSRATADWLRLEGIYWEVQSKSFGPVEGLPPTGANANGFVAVAVLLLALGAALAAMRRRSVMTA